MVCELNARITFAMSTVIAMMSFAISVVDRKDNLLPLDFRQVNECGVRLLDAKDKDEIRCFALTRAPDYPFCPLDQDELEANVSISRMTMLIPAFSIATLPVAMAHCTNDLSSQITYFLDMILV
ncbi:hypothetical protein POTOM_058325 [Populus tomentosa]|uniref:Uncharacterized protein n=1 Tax=Populus tomentosa TaxID=118781 RepID=A0A8X7XR86_POPTO|nr:hypothetical protein POTOM_058325 [Populus tomentosa]